ncbi:MAG TPA: ribosome biogenesis GTPase Der, partial [Polyangia bacterium]
MARRGRKTAADLAAEELAARPLVALIGRPNVGKSSLFNRLVGGRPALVEDVPGVTRDRRYGVCEWNRAVFRVVDTGGLDPSAEGILGAMRGQTLRAVDEGDLLLLVVDATEGVTAVDADVARLLRRTGKPVFVAVNKADSAQREAAAGEAFSLGYDNVFPISAAHGRGVGDLCDAIVEALGPATSTRPVRHPLRDADARPEGDDDEGAVGQDDEGAQEEDADAESIAAPASAIRIAFVGKPNVGKSSLVNRLLGQERVLVHDQPGTTRDPIDTPFRLGEQDYVLVDTAGLRRRRTIESLTEAVAAKMSRDQLARADVAVLVIDLQKGATMDDAKLASFIEESGRATVIVLNKADLVPRAALDAQIEASKKVLSFVGFAPVVLASARTGRGVLDIVSEARRVFREWSRRVGTADLNKNFEKIVTRRPPPSGPGGRHVRLYYATQADVCPPTFYISANLPTAVGAPYQRYLVNQLRQVYGFEGSPIRVALRAHKSKKEGTPHTGSAPRGPGARSGAQRG